MFLRVLLPRHGATFRFRAVDKVDFLRHITSNKFIKRFTANHSSVRPILLFTRPTQPFMNLTCNDTRITSHVRFGQRVLMANQRIFHNLKGRTVMFLATRVQSFGTAFINRNNFTRRFPVERHSIVNKRHATIRANFSTFHIVTYMFSRAV